MSTILLLTACCALLIHAHLSREEIKDLRAENKRKDERVAGFESENATLRQATHHLSDIADDYERERDAAYAERDAGYAERDEYKRQRDVAEEQRDDYSKGGVALTRENERLARKVQDLESAKQSRDEHGRFLPLAGTHRV